MAKLTDDLTIPDEEALWRNIPPWHLVPDDSEDGWRISSAAFDDDSDGDPMSVTIASVAAKIERTPTQHLDSIVSPYVFSLASITAGLARSYEQGIVRDPEPANLAHGKVFGDKPRSVKKKLAKNTQWVILNPRTK